MEVDFILYWYLFKSKSTVFSCNVYKSVFLVMYTNVFFLITYTNLLFFLITYINLLFFLVTYKNLSFFLVTYMERGFGYFILNYIIIIKLKK